MTKVEDYDYIRFTVADIHGSSRGRVFPLRHAQKCIDSGVTLFGGTLLFNLGNKFVSSSKDDPDSEQIPPAIMKPDMETIYSVSWNGGDKFKVAELICESYWLKDNTPQQACPRSIARHQLERLTEYGFELLSGLEIEFTFHKNGSPFPSEPNYISQREQAKHSEFFLEAEHHLYCAGVDVESMHTDYGAGVFESVLEPMKGIAAADAGFKFKNGIQEIADKHTANVSFKTKQENVDIGIHFNHSLWSVSEKINVFDSKEGLSKTGTHWLGGLMKHAKTLTALFNPTVNCYERLHQPHKPSAVFWGYDERSACVRVKLSDTQKGVYLENRMPSSMSNPYLVLAATVAAGLDGVIHRIDCPPPGENTAYERLPSTLSEALRDLLVDKEMTDCLGQGFVDAFAATINSDIKSSQK